MAGQECAVECLCAVDAVNAIVLDVAGVDVVSSKGYCTGPAATQRVWFNRACAPGTFLVGVLQRHKLAVLRGEAN
jgi:hypothetical protein